MLVVYAHCESLLGEMKVSEKYNSSIKKISACEGRVSRQWRVSVCRGLQLLCLAYCRNLYAVYQKYESSLSEIRVSEECDSSVVKIEACRVRVSRQLRFSFYRSLKLLLFPPFRDFCAVCRKCDSSLRKIRVCEEYNSSLLQVSEISVQCMSSLRLCWARLAFMKSIILRL